MDWDDLRYVLAVAEHGTLSGAARALGVRHSTVQRRIAVFEREKSVTLFERTKSGYALSVDSRHLLAKLRTIDENVNALDRAMVKQGLELDGPVRITTTDSIAAAGLARHLAAFREQNPGAIVQLNMTNLHVDFTRLEADITIRPALALPPELVGEKACDMVMRIYASPAYLDSHRDTSFAAHKWLGVGPPITSSVVGAWQQRHISPAAMVMEASSFVGLRHAAEADMGLALLPCCVGDLAPGLVRARGFEDSGVVTHVWVATHKDLVESEKVQSILAWFTDAIRQDSDLYEGHRIRH
jgi:DNA-binding transcriptional LysR family regulator